MTLQQALESESSDSLGIIVSELIDQYPKDDLLVALQLKNASLSDKDSISLFKNKSLADSIGGTFCLDALGFYYHSLGDTIQARHYYNESFLRDSLKVNFMVLLDLAFLEEDGGNMEKAAKLLQMAHHLAPKVSTVNISLVENYMNRQMYHEALSVLDSFPLYKFKALHKAQALEGIKNYTQAESLYRELILTDSNSCLYQKKLFDLYILKLFDIPKAKEVFRIMEKKCADSLQVLHSKAIIFSNEKLFHESNSIYLKLIKSNPVITYYGDLSINYIKIGDFKKANLFIDEAFNKFGSTYDLELLKLIALKGIGQKENYLSYEKHLLAKYGEIIFEHVWITCSNTGIKYEYFFNK